MPELSFFHKSRIILGNDTLLALPILAANLVAPEQVRPLLIVDPILQEYGQVEKVAALLESNKMPAVVFDHTHEGYSAQAASQALELARAGRINLVISMGGQDCLMMARAVAALAKAPFGVETLLGDKPQAISPLHSIELPTGLHHPLLADSCIALVDGHTKQIMLKEVEGSSPDLILIVPDLTVSLGAKLAACSIITLLMEVFEAYLSNKSQFLSDHYLEGAARYLSATLDSYASEGMPSQSVAWRGIILATLGISLSSLGAGSAIAYMIDAHFNVHKGCLGPIFLPEIIQKGTQVRMEKIVSLASRISADFAIDSQKTAIDKLQEWLHTRLGILSIPSRLKDYDLKLESLIQHADEVRSLEFMNYIPWPFAIEDIIDFIKIAY